MTDDAIIYNEQLTHSQNPERMTTKRRGETLPFYRDRGQTQPSVFLLPSFSGEATSPPLLTSGSVRHGDQYKVKDKRNKMYSPASLLSIA